MTDYPIIIADFNSSNIRSVAAQADITHMREIGSGYARGVDENGNATIDNTGNSEAHITAYEFSDGTRVIDTNGDPVWEDQDAQVFAELAESADIEL